MIIQSRSQKDLIDQIISQGVGIYISLSITSYNNLRIFREKQVENDEYYFLDGQGAVIFENIRSRKLIFKKLPGCEVWLNLIAQIADQNIALIGATKEVIHTVKIKIEERYKNVKVPVCIHGFQELNVEDIVGELNQNDVKFVFIALGQPDQECLARELLQRHPAIYMPIGGSFDILSGYMKRAPFVYRMLMLEWLYRILTKPNKIKNLSTLIKGFFFAQSCDG